LRDEVPHTLERVIARALAKHAGDRFQSMEELGDELGRIAKTLGKVRVDDTPVARPRRESAQPTPSAEAPEIVAPPQSLPDQRKPSRKKWIALGVGGVAVAASVVAFFALRDGNAAAKPPAGSEPARDRRAAARQPIGLARYGVALDRALRRAQGSRRRPAGRPRRRRDA
jgi:hypothetical protein